MYRFQSKNDTTKVLEYQWILVFVLLVSFLFRLNVVKKNVLLFLLLSVHLKMRQTRQLTVCIDFFSFKKVFNVYIFKL